MCFGGGSADKDAKRARREEDARKARIQQGTAGINTTFNTNFSEPYFANQRQAYIGYATPQLDDQYKDANKQLTFALARTGTLDSSARATQAGELQKLYDINKQGVVDQARTYESQARGSVEDARAGLISNLNVTGDATQAANAALARANALSAAPAYQPLVGAFNAFTSGLGVQAAQERAASMSGGSYQSRYNTGLFGTPTGAVVNRR